MVEKMKQYSGVYGVDYFCIDINNRSTNELLETNTISPLLRHIFPNHKYNADYPLQVCKRHLINSINSRSKNQRVIKKSIPLKKNDVHLETQLKKTLPLLILIPNCPHTRSAYPLIRNEKKKPQTNCI